MIERVAARQRELAHQHHAAGIPVLGCKLGEQHQQRRICRLVAEVGQHRPCQLAGVVGVEQLSSADDFA